LSENLRNDYMKGTSSKVWQKTCTYNSTKGRCLACPGSKHGTYQAGYEIDAVSIVVVIHLHLTGNPFLLASF
jgi:hypothetical protein